MPRRNYSDRAGRRRPQQQRTDWSWLLELLATERRYRRPTPQTPDALRAGPVKENR